MERGQTEHEEWEIVVRSGKRSSVIRVTFPSEAEARSAAVSAREDFPDMEFEVRRRPADRSE